MTNIHLDSYDILKDIHIRWNFKSNSAKPVRLKGISFNYLNKFEVQHPEELFDLQGRDTDKVSVFFTLGINRWNGNEYIQLMVDRVEL